MYTTDIVLIRAPIFYWSSMCPALCLSELSGVSANQSTITLRFRAQPHWVKWYLQFFLARLTPYSFGVLEGDLACQVKWHTAYAQHNEVYNSIQ